MMQMSVYDALQAELTSAQDVLAAAKQNLEHATTLYDAANHRVVSLVQASMHLGDLQEVKTELEFRKQVKG